MGVQIGPVLHIWKRQVRTPAHPHKTTYTCNHTSAQCEDRRWHMVTEEEEEKDLPRKRCGITVQLQQQNASDTLSTEQHMKRVRMGSVVCYCGVSVAQV